ncbi:response regulator [Streptomyces alkaliterrae]|uniref:Response regulator n=1 Tax=Streptomyces alkaliterrae TaxID=2213162 RepID=A0A5P0YXC2_9ACTN|nr:response regulator transcription factor [Streptomyces alkaliterrae]MBB1255857.1 response regulator transcription factor [Streptomyces alkaliterrae]MBB1261893.1 response regulator transcription factor [Streptomyces alkaliterrae]MQS03139.1 response regulator [Streptomyces alkaliterrae]
MIRVVVVDDEELVRSGVRLILGSAPGIEVVAECAGAQAVSTVQQTRPDVLLLDIRMPHTDGLAVLREIRTRADAGDGHWPAVCMLTTFDADDYLSAALHLGAAGYLLKDADPARLIETVRVLADGGSTLDPAVTPTVIGGYLHRSGDAPEAVRAVAALTPREREVLALLAEGLSNALIADRLGLAHGTVKDHVSALLGKLGGLNRVQAAVLADRAGLTRRDGDSGNNTR